MTSSISATLYNNGQTMLSYTTKELALVVPSSIVDDSILVLNRISLNAFVWSDYNLKKPPPSWWDEPLTQWIGGPVIITVDGKPTSGILKDASQGSVTIGTPGQAGGLTVTTIYKKYDSITSSLPMHINMARQEPPNTLFFPTDTLNSVQDRTCTFLMNGLNARYSYTLVVNHLRDTLQLGRCLVHVNNTTNLEFPLTHVSFLVGDVVEARAPRHMYRAQAAYAYGAAGAAAPESALQESAPSYSINSTEGEFHKFTLDHVPWTLMPGQEDHKPLFQLQPMKIVPLYAFQLNTGIPMEKDLQAWSGLHLKELPHDLPPGQLLFYSTKDEDLKTDTEGTTFIGRSDFNRVVLKRETPDLFFSKSNHVTLDVSCESVFDKGAFLKEERAFKSKKVTFKGTLALVHGEEISDQALLLFSIQDPCFNDTDIKMNAAVMVLQNEVKFRGIPKKDGLYFELPMTKAFPTGDTKKTEFSILIQFTRGS